MPDLFGKEPVTVQDMIGCAERELKMRRSVYPRWVALKKMTQDEADRELRVMKAIVDYLADR